MNKEQSEILDKLGKDAGFRTPDGYFNDFKKNLMSQLPETTTNEETNAKPNLWVRWRPYVYMAAMIAGIVCMINIFNGINNTSQLPGMAKGLEDPIGSSSIIGEQKINDTIITNYEDSVRNTAFEVVE